MQEDATESGVRLKNQSGLVRSPPGNGGDDHATAPLVHPAHRGKGGVYILPHSESLQVKITARGLCETL